MCDVKVVPLTDEGFLDFQALDNIIIENISKYKKIICSFSAGSNVTGIVTNVKKVISVVKKYDVLLFFDYAGVGPYVEIDLSQSIDGIYLSPHKFLGGPGTCGLAIFKKSIYNKKIDPTHGGGGTVDFVNENLVFYTDDIEARE